MFNRRSILAAGLTPVFTGFGTLAQTNTLSIDELCEEPTTVDAAVSPDGLRVATLRQKIVRDPGKDEKKDKRSAFVALRHVSEIDAVKVFPLGELTVESIEWANNDVMLVRIIWTTGVLTARRIATLSVDGKLEYLIDDSTSVGFRNLDHGTIVDNMPNDPAKMLIMMGDRVLSLFEIDIYTRKFHKIEEGEEGTIRWVSKDGVPVVRIDSNPAETVLTFKVRALGEKKWVEVWKAYRSQFSAPDIDNIFVSQETDIIYISSYGENENYRALHKFNVRTQSWAGRLTAQQNDVISFISDPAGRYLGAIFADDTDYYDCPDKTLNDDLKTIREAFPNSNVRAVSISTNAEIFIFLVTGPQQSGLYVYYNRTLGAVGLLDERRSGQKSDRLAPMQGFNVTSKDGHKLRAYLSIPRVVSSKALVVMPHGGPEVRDYLDYDIYAQLLTSQGWMVVQPNFRGSSGYGKAFADAGRREWNGLVMEDIEATVDAIVAAGVIDPRKVAIFGASFGGYAALMSAVRRPKQYAAVVSLAGVSDLPRILRDESVAGLQSPSYLYWKRTLGDINTERERIEMASPTLRAAEIEAPVLLMHGKLDNVVDIEQSRVMSRALRRANKVQQLVEYDDMPHGPNNFRDLRDVSRRLVDFLKPHLDG